MLAAFERYWALTIKEGHQLRRNKRLLVQLIIPPTLVLVIFGFALNPEVSNLRTGIVDESHTPASRELLSALTEFEAFQVVAHYGSAADAEAALRRLEIELAILVPADYARTLARGQTVEIQVLIDAVNANTAAIASGYLAQAVRSYNVCRQFGGATCATAPRPASFTAGGPAGASLLNPRAESVILYNPGLIYPWFFVTGIMSVLMFLNGALVASALAVREKELGTIEQLLMSPAQTLEMLLAKTTPVLTVLLADLVLALAVSRLVFDLPVRGSLFALLVAATLAALAGTGIGITLATYSSTQQQAQLLTFFMLPPMVLLSGAFAPLESIPVPLQYISLIDPLRYLVIVVRGITLKGAGVMVLWQPLTILAGFAVVLYGLSTWRFRKQLG